MTIGRSRHRNPFRRRAAWLGIFAVLVRCVIAPGLMPDLVAGARGAFKLVICTSGGAKLLPTAPEDGRAADHRHDVTLCPYSALGHVATLADPVPPLDARFASAVAQSAPHATARRIHPLKPGARAPPKLS